MSLTIETLLGCNGGEQCPLDAPFCQSDIRHMTGAEQRKRAKQEGWVQVGKLDYCPDCAARLGLKIKGTKP